MVPALHCSLLLIAACKQVGEALLDLEAEAGPDDAAQPEVTDSAENNGMDSISASGSEERQHDSASNALQASFGRLQRPRLCLAMP